MIQRLVSSQISPAYPNPGLNTGHRRMGSVGVEREGCRDCKSKLGLKPLYEFWGSVPVIETLDYVGRLWLEHHSISEQDSDALRV